MIIAPKNKKPGKKGPPFEPGKDTPARPDENPDPTLPGRNGNDPERIDPTRISDPQRIDPTRIDEPESEEEEATISPQKT
jgi:hypothetical protein